MKNSLIWKLVHPCTTDSNLITKLESDFSLRTSLLVYFGFLLKYETITMVYSKIVSIKQRVEANKIVSRKNSMNPNFSNNRFPNVWVPWMQAKSYPIFSSRVTVDIFSFYFAGVCLLLKYCSKNVVDLQLISNVLQQSLLHYLHYAFTIITQPQMMQTRVL